MKIISITTIITFFIIINTLMGTAQNGGLQLGHINLSDSLSVGTGSHFLVLENMMALPPITDDEILNIVDPPIGAVVFSSSINNLLFFNGIGWKRVDNTTTKYFNEPEHCEDTFYDLDNNPFTGVQIGSQCWMKTNLRVTHYPNGTSIPFVTGDSDWRNLENNNTADGYCYYHNDYGALYTYSAAIARNWENDSTDGQGICPKGWHLPTEEEWITLYTELGGADVAGGSLKETGRSHFTEINIGATNSSGFTALPGGIRNNDFQDLGLWGYFNMATESSNSMSQLFIISYEYTGVEFQAFDKSTGASVRCLKNE